MTNINIIKWRNQSHWSVSGVPIYMILKVTRRMCCLHKLQRIEEAVNEEEAAVDEDERWYQ